MALLKRFVQEQEGLETVEYAVLAALVIGAVVTAVSTLGGAISTRFTKVTSAVNSN